MISFKDDENLGKVVTSTKLYSSIGVEHTTSLFQIKMAAGGNKFSSLCGFIFESANESTELKKFAISFVCKLRSRIYRQQTNNPSQWYIMRFVSKTQVDILDKKACLINYGFDVDKFMQSDMFKRCLPKFNDVLQKGLKTADSYMQTLGTRLQNECKTYVDAIKSAIPLMMHSTRVNDKYYQLKDLDAFSSRDTKNETENNMKTVNETAVNLDDLEEVTIHDMLKVARSAFPHSSDGGKMSPIVGIVDGHLADFTACTFAKHEGHPDPGTFFLHDGTLESLNALEEQLAVGKYDESEIAEADESAFRCKITKKREDGRNVWSVNELDGTWVATFHNEDDASTFAKQYPKMKSKYIASAYTEAQEVDESAGKGSTLKEILDDLNSFVKDDSEWLAAKVVAFTEDGKKYKVDFVGQGDNDEIIVNLGKRMKLENEVDEAEAVNEASAELEAEAKKLKQYDQKKVKWEEVTKLAELDVGSGEQYIWLMSPNGVLVCRIDPAKSRADNNDEMSGYYIVDRKAKKLVEVGHGYVGWPFKYGFVPNSTEDIPDGMPTTEDAEAQIKEKQLDNDIEEALSEIYS